MLTIEADIYEYVGMSYVDKNILGPLVHMIMTWTTFITNLIMIPIQIMIQIDDDY